MSVIVFIGVHVIGNPVDILISPEADQAERARVIAALGLDQPLWRQYLLFVGDALHGDLGRSFVFNEPALRPIAHRTPATMELCGQLPSPMSMFIGIPSGRTPDRTRGGLARTIMAGSILGFSPPTFWVGLMLIDGVRSSACAGHRVRAVARPWHCSASMVIPDAGRLRHLALPALNFVAVQHFRWCCV